MVGARSKMRGLHTGEFFGIAPTGPGAEVRVHDFHEIVDGRIVRTHHMEDWLSCCLASTWLVSQLRHRLPRSAPNTRGWKVWQLTRAEKNSGMAGVPMAASGAGPRIRWSSSRPATVSR